MSEYIHLSPGSPESAPERIDPTEQLSELNIQLRHARSVAALLGATSRSADIDADEVQWAADCVVSRLDDSLSRVALLSKRGAMP